MYEQAMGMMVELMEVGMRFGREMRIWIFERLIIKLKQDLPLHQQRLVLLLLRELQF
jgi:hypothetical protein